MPWLPQAFSGPDSASCWKCCAEELHDEAASPKQGLEEVMPIGLTMWPEALTRKSDLVEVVRSRSPRNFSKEVQLLDHADILNSVSEEESSGGSLLQRSAGLADSSQIVTMPTEVKRHERRGEASTISTSTGVFSRSRGCVSLIDSPACFWVELERSKDGDKVGMSLDSTGGKLLQVVRIAPDGLIAKYNQTASEDHQVKCRYMITQVNNIKQSAALMMDELKRERKLALLVCPTMQLSVTIPRPGNTFALDFHCEDESTFLIITSIQEGPIQDYNRSVRDEKSKVWIWDRVIEVNGVSGVAKALLAELSRCNQATLKLTRPTPA